MCAHERVPFFQSPGAGGLAGRDQAAGPGPGGRFSPAHPGAATGSGGQDHAAAAPHDRRGDRLLAVPMAGQTGDLGICRSGTAICIPPAGRRQNPIVRQHIDLRAERQDLAGRAQDGLEPGEASGQRRHPRRCPRPQPSPRRNACHDHPRTQVGSVPPGRNGTPSAQLRCRTPIRQGPCCLACSGGRLSGAAAWLVSGCGRGAVRRFFPRPGSPGMMAGFGQRWA